MNCITYAVKKFINEGGYLAVRRTRVTKGPTRKPGKWLHVLWIKDLKDAEIEHYVPNTFDEHKVSPPISFDGYVKKDDR